MTRALARFAACFFLASPAFAQPPPARNWANAPPCRTIEKERLEEFETLVKKPTERAFDPLHQALLPEATEATRLACQQRVESFTDEQEGQANDGVHSWLLAAPCKEAVCGQLDGFESNLQTPWLSGEHDFNHNIVDLDGTALERLEEHGCPPEENVVSLAAASGGTRADARDVGRFVVRQRPNVAPPLPAEPEQPKVVPLRSEPRCIPKPGEWWLHVEITPAVPLRGPLKKLWYEPGAWLAWRKSVADQSVCVYGPLVLDTSHDKTEIHPAQLFWWREASEGASVVPGNSAFFVLQDASSRYNKDHNFVLEKPFPENGLWRPWAKGPVHGRFRIPFRFGEGEPPIFIVAPYFGTWKKELDDCLARPEEKKPCGRLPLGPAEARWLKPPSPDGLEVRAEFVCRDDSAGAPEFKGIFTVEARTGSDREWREGALALRLVDSRQSQPPDFLAAGWERAKSRSWAKVTDAETKSLRTALLEATGWAPDAVTLGTVRALKRARLGIGALRLEPEVVEVGIASRLPPAEVRLLPCPEGLEVKGVRLVRNGQKFEARMEPGPFRCVRAAVRLPSGIDVPASAAEATVSPVESPNLWSHALFAPDGKEDRANWEDEFAMSAALLCRQLVGEVNPAREVEAANVSRRLADDGVLTGDDLSIVADRIRQRCAP